MAGDRRADDLVTMHRAHRVHFDTGSGTLCGTRLVIGWTTRAVAVTCRVCRARLTRAALGQPGQAAPAAPHGSSAEAAGHPQALAAS